MVGQREAWRQEIDRSCVSPKCAFGQVLNSMPCLVVTMKGWQCKRLKLRNFPGFRLGDIKTLTIVYLVFQVCFFALSGHWLACVWYVIAKNSVRDGHKIVDFNWLVLIGEQTNRPYRIEGKMPQVLLKYSLTCDGLGELKETILNKVVTVTSVKRSTLLHITIARLFIAVPVI